MDGFVFELVRSKRRGYRITYDSSRDVFTASIPLELSQGEFEREIRKHGRALGNMRKRALKRKEGDYYLFGERHAAPVDAGYRRKAYGEYLADSVRRYVQKDRIAFPVSVFVRDMKTRLGTNNVAKRKLTFSLSLSSFSKEVIDSVVAHEISHFAYLSHGKYFYRHLLKLFPDYRNCRRSIVEGDFEYGKQNNHLGQ